MVWVFEDPPYTERELNAYRSIKRKLKDKQLAENLIKIVSLYMYLKRQKFSSASDIQKSAYFDKSKTRPIFNLKSANKILKSLTQKGGDSKYPYADVLIKGLLRDYSPEVIAYPVGSIYSAVTDTVDTLKDNIPFSDLALEAIHGTTELGVTTANDIGELVGGPIGSLAVAPFTAVAAGLASTLATAEGDIGGAVAHLANWVPGIGIVLNKAMVETENIADKLKGHEYISSLIPYMTEYHNTGGKRFSTYRHKLNKWRKTHRKKLRKV